MSESSFASSEQRRDCADREPPKSGVAVGDPFSCHELSPFYYKLRERALELGLADLGLVPVGEASTYDLFLKRVVDGSCADLSYLVDDPEKRRDPRSVASDAKTTIVVALSESRLDEESRIAGAAPLDAPELRGDAESGVGAIVGYATRLDYHDVLRQKLKELGRFVQANFPSATFRAAVDTAPILEKDFARRAGLGFVGLNSLLISPEIGSRFFLGEVLVSTTLQELCGLSTSEEYLAARREARISEGLRAFDPDAAERACLSCRRCVDACPTDAPNGDRTLNARRCLNFWTIENRSEIPPEVAEKLDGELFGCDLCQRVCPWNKNVDAIAPKEIPLDAVERLDEATFRRLFKKTPIFRATLDGLRRVANALREDERNGEKRE